MLKKAEGGLIVQAEIMLHIKEKDSFVAADDFVEVAGNLLHLLREIEFNVSNSRQSNLNWVIRDLKSGSASIVLEGIPKNSVNYTVSDITLRMIQGLRMLEEGKAIPPFFSDEAIRYARGIASKVGKTLDSLIISTSNNIVSITKKLVSNVDALLDTFTVEESGTIVGTLKMITTVGVPYFNVYDSVTGKAVRCDFDLESLKTVLGAMERGRVSVSGLIYYDSEGYPKRIKNPVIEPLPLECELPTLEEIIALDLDLSGGLSLQEFMEKRHHERE